MRRSRESTIPLTDNRNVSSSPDPLNDSLTDQRSFISSPIKRRSSQGVIPKQRRASGRLNGPPSSPFSTAPHALVSPTKTITEQTLSPWKIRVTVEAEPEGSDAAEMMQTYTKTTTIPLRGESSPLQSIESVNPDRGRRSESQTRSKTASKSTSRTRQRSGTPKPGRGRRQSVTDLDIVVLGDDNEEDEWGVKPRKSSARSNSTKRRGSSTKRPEHSKGISSVIDKFVINEDANIEPGYEDHEVLHSESPELRQIDLNKVSVRPRSNSTKQKAKKATSAEDCVPSKEADEQISYPDLKGARRVSVNSTRSYPTPSPTPSDSDPIVPHTEEDHADACDTVIESEGFTMIDLDSIPSVQRLRSSPASQYHVEAEQPAILEPEANRSIEHISPPKPVIPTPSKAFPSYLYLAEGESDISSAVPSSPPLPTSQVKESQHQSLGWLQVPSSISHSKDRKVTPQTYSSPKLPSPPRPVLTHKRDILDSSQAVQAGMTLQGAIDATKASEQEQSAVKQPIRTPRTQTVSQDGETHSLFEGFDSGTQRELRAGLRLGEELAKKPGLSSVSKPSGLNIPALDSQPQVWRVHQIQHHQNVPYVAVTSARGATHPDSVRGTRRSSMLNQSINMSDVSSISNGDNLTDPSTGETPKDLRWQHKRDEVIKQAHKADPDDVITLDENDSGDHAVHDERPAEAFDVTMEDADDGDIWLAEAKDSSSSPREVEHLELFNKTDQKRQREQASHVIERVRRNVLPKSRPVQEPAEHDANNTTILTSGEGESSVSGLLWQAPHDREYDVRFGAGQIKDTRRGLRQSGAHEFYERKGSGAFDINKMLATPKRIRESLEPPEGPPEATRPELSPSNEVSQEVEETAQLEEDSASIPPQTIPVRFNDSSSSILESSPYKQRRSLSPSANRPPTPRSAIKGARQSAGPDSLTSSTEALDAAARRVVWARRSNYVDEDWIESSRSVISSDSMSSPQVLLTAATVQNTTLEPKPQPQLPQSSSTSNISTDKEQGQWFGWIRGSKSVTSEDSRPVETVDCSLSGLHVGEESQVSVANEENSELWHQTSRSAARIEPTTAHLHGKSNTKSTRSKLPTYLLAPSYPSDPRRSPTNQPLTTSGEFTNTHFRTLHIIYAKSSRPRFHAPQIEECRPEIRNLVTTKWQMDVDEEHAGLGGFTFKLGVDMGRVLERFCREVEWDHLSPLVHAGELDLHDLLSLHDGIWSGKEHGLERVKWGWSCEMLAEWLGRIVVGEVVRNEEFGGKEFKK